MKFKKVTVFLLGLALTACSSTGGGGGKGAGPKAPPEGPKFILVEPPPIQTVISLKKTQNIEELISEFRKISLSQMNATIDFNSNYCENIYQKQIPPKFSPDSSPAALPATTGPSTFPTTAIGAGRPEAAFFTETNKQESEVDEADLIKADGSYTYSIHGSKLGVTQVWPAEAFQKKGSIEIEGKPIKLFLTGKRVVVLSQPDFDLTKVTIFDVSNPAEPKRARQYSYEGRLIGERGVGGNIHLVFNSRIAKIPVQDEVDGVLLPKCDGTDNKETIAKHKERLEKLREEKRKVIEALDFSALGLSPQIASLATAGGVVDYYYDSYDPADTMIHLVTINGEELEKEDHTMLFGSGERIYASTNALYVANSIWGSTTIHRFDIKKKPVYTGGNKVDGWLLNQFAMGEYKGTLRLATKIGGRNTKVFTLDTASPTLDVLGKIEDIGKNEDLYSVRFIGPRGYVVTFKKVDPLFVLDLADPKNPKVSGELKIPGFSTYLHPMEESHLIGLGKDADDQGSFAWFQGLKLSLFDVSKASEPKEVQALVIGGRGSGSEAAYDHHAFTFDLSQRLLAIPVSYFGSTSGGSQYGDFEYNGVHLYKVTSEEGFKSVGIFKWNQTNPGEDSPWAHSHYENTIRRSILIGNEGAEAIITYRNNGLGIHKLDASLTELHSIEWSE